MFDREARLHAAVTHENVVTVFGAGHDEKGEPYLAMEYIDGVDGYRLLRRLRQEDELLPVGVAVFVACEVLRALESVHAARDPSSGGSLGIVHRDVSPSNIYLSKDGKVKLGDFGIARSTTRTTLRSDDLARAITQQYGVPSANITSTTFSGLKAFVLNVPSAPDLLPSIQGANWIVFVMQSIDHLGQEFFRWEIATARRAGFRVRGESAGCFRVYVERVFRRSSNPPWKPRLAGQGARAQHVR